MMNKLLTGAFAASALMLLYSGCSDTFDPTSDREGRIFLNVSLNHDVKAARAETQSRATGYAKEIGVEDLKLKLKAEDGSMERTWSSVSQFDASEDFPVGGYVFEASYGDVADEGFDKAFYFGSTSLRVMENQTTPVELTASLANSMITLRYTDKVRNYFSSFRGVVNTAGGTSFDYPDGEARALYVKPGTVSVDMDVTSQTGAKGKIKIWTMDARPRYHYVLTVDKSDAGDAMFTITFSTELVEETVTVDLSDEILNAPAPTISANGFVPGEAVTVVEGGAVEGSLDMTVVAPGTVNGAILRTTSASLQAQGWPEVVDFATADAGVIATLRNLGLRFPGLEGVKSRMAMVDFSGVISHLAYVDGADNTSVFTLEAKDNYMKVSEPLTLTVNVEKLNLEIADIEPLAIEASQLTFTLAYNGGDPEQTLGFQLKNARGIWDDVKPLSVEAAATRMVNAYKVVLPVPADANDVIFRMLRGAKVYEEQTVTRAGAVVALSGNDVFATRATLSVGGANAASLAADAVVMLSTDGVSFSEYTFKAVNGGDITLSGLQPAAKYYVKLVVNNGESKTVEFTTEADTQLPNAGMEEWCQASSGKNWSLVYPGATEQTSAWGTNNPMTTSQGGNFAYCRISGTIGTDDGHSGKAALIRSVGWGSGNTAIGTVEGGAVCKYLDAGLLHLGASRSTRPEGYGDRAGTVGTDDLDCGIEFASRPSSLSFWYKYFPKNSADAGLAEVIVKDAEGNVIASGKTLLTAASGYTLETLPLTYAKGAPKCAGIYVRFLSTNSETFLQKSNDYFSAPPLANLSDGTYMGSQLYIDDIALNY